MYYSVVCVLVKHGGLWSFWGGSWFSVAISEAAELAVWETLPNIQLNLRFAQLTGMLLSPLLNIVVLKFHILLFNKRYFP